MSDAVIPPQGPESNDATVGGAEEQGWPAGEVRPGGRAPQDEHPAPTVGSTQPGDATVSDQEQPTWPGFEIGTRVELEDVPPVSEPGAAAPVGGGTEAPMPRVLPESLGKGGGLPDVTGEAADPLSTPFDVHMPAQGKAQNIADPLGKSPLPPPTGETPEAIQKFMDEAAEAKSKHPHPDAASWPEELTAPDPGDVINLDIPGEPPADFDLTPGLDLPEPPAGALERPQEIDLEQAIWDQALGEDPDHLQYSSQPIEYSIEITDPVFHPGWQHGQMLMGKPTEIGKGGPAKKGPAGETPPGQKRSIGSNSGPDEPGVGDTDRTGTAPIGGFDDSWGVEEASEKTKTTWVDPETGDGVSIGEATRGRRPVGGDWRVPTSGMGGVVSGHETADQAGLTDLLLQEAPIGEHGGPEKPVGGDDKKTPIGDEKKPETITILTEEQLSKLIGKETHAAAVALIFGKIKFPKEDITSNCDSDCVNWTYDKERKGIKLKEGADAYEAINEIFKTPEKFTFDCTSAAMLTLCRGIQQVFDKSGLPPSTAKKLFNDHIAQSMGGPESELRFTSHHVFGYTGYIPTRGVFGRATDRTVRKGDYVRIDNFARSTDSDIHGANCVAMSDQKGKHDRPPDELLVYTHSGTRDRFKRVGKIIDGYKKQNKKDGLEGKVVASTVWERFKPAAVKATIDEAAKKEEKSRADRAARVRAGTKKK